ncbi:cyanophycin synthetase [Parvibium lacunae]|uniref:Cyanophycin synthetase n=1 Tax=Parvibium lacunae TaxID=1888893 RepID=A0A368L7J6_9BURK|nr:cyanophycin synthetase [Parvibium lacunae]RCS59219.1 cyanophycin synthetase [Parvibium lacunae]
MTFPPIQFLQMHPLRGPNMWTYVPVIEAWIDIGVLEDHPSNTIPGFYDRLAALLPGLIEHRCSYEERGGFLKRLAEGTWPAHIMEHVTLELLTMAGMSGGFGRAREMSQRGHYKVIVSTWTEAITQNALLAARDLVHAAMNDQPFDVAAAVAQLRDQADDECLGPSTASIVEAASARKIPSIRLNDGNLVQLGYGAAARRIWTAETDRTCAIAEGIAGDKDLTKSLLAPCGVPVPEGRMVENAADAWAAAQEIGAPDVPVVVKPYDGNHGRGVFIDLKTEKEITTAYGVASEEGSGVLVERYIRGLEHRLLVVGDQLVAAAKGDSAWVTGDGQHTVYELIQLQINSDPRRGDTEEHPLNRLGIDSAARVLLAQQGFTEDSVPPAGVTVEIQRNGNVGIDITDEVHPDTASLAVLAAQIVGLDIAGIDLVAQDIRRPLDEQGGAIVEVNAGPGLLMHLRPALGQPRPVGQAIVNHLFAPQSSNPDGRIPVIGITGTNGKTAVARLVSHIMQLSGKHVGLACSDGLYFDRRQLEKGAQDNWQGAQRTLRNRAVDVAVLENGIPTLLTEGTGYDRCHIGVVTQIGSGDHLGLFDIQEREKLYTVCRTQVDLVLPQGAAILNAQDPLVAEMAELCDGEVIFFATDGNHTVIQEQLEQGKRAVFLRQGRIVLAQGGDEEHLADLIDLPITEQGQVAFQVDNVLAASATAWAMGMPAALIRTGLETFGLAQSKSPQLPGRFTLLQDAHGPIVVDSARNLSAVEALVAALRQHPQTRHYQRQRIVFAARPQSRPADAAALRRALENDFTQVHWVTPDTLLAAQEQALRERQPDELLILQTQQGQPLQQIEQIKKWLAE